MKQMTVSMMLQQLLLLLIGVIMIVLSVRNSGVLLPNGCLDGTWYGCISVDQDDIVLDGDPDPTRKGT